MKNVVIVPNVKFARGDIRAIKFSANQKRVRVTCEGKWPLIVKQDKTSGLFECKPKGQAKGESFPLCKTPEQAYKAGVKEFWVDQ